LPCAVFRMARPHWFIPKGKNQMPLAKVNYLT